MWILVIFLWALMIHMCVTVASVPFLPEMVSISVICLLARETQTIEVPVVYAYFSFL
jgi:hypothetical protein